VESVVVVPVQQWMYNLTVDVAHNFFVGHQGWLVHNAKKCNISFQPKGGFSGDVLTKGFHLNSDVGELSLLPRRVAQGGIEIVVVGAKANTGINNKVVNGVSDFLSANPAATIDRAKGIISTFKYDPRYANRVAEAELLIKALSGGNYSVVK